MDKTLIILLSGLGFFLFLTMPAQLCPSDTYASRAEAAHFINTGEYGFDYSWKNSPVGEFLVPNKGDYFYENDQRQRFFSKYGIMNSILYLPPLLAQRIWTGTKLDEVDESRGLVFFLNLNNIGLALVCVYFLYRLAGNFADRQALRVVFVLLSVFTSFTWYFFRAHMHELFQLVFFLGFCSYFVDFLRQSQVGDESRSWNVLRLALICAGLLTLTKLLFVLVFIPAWAFALVAGPAGLSRRERLRSNLAVNRWRLWRFLVLPSAFFALAFLLINYYKTGLQFGTGYEQESNDGVAAVTFSLRFLAESLPAFFLKSGNANLLLHAPLLLAALVGLVGFSRRWPREAGFLLGTAFMFLLVIGSYQFWPGELTYGPRFLFLPAVIAALPALVALDYLREKFRKPVVAAGAVLLAVVFLWSLVMQVMINSVNFWPNMRQYEVFETFQDDEIEQYFAGYFHKGIVSAQLISYRLGWAWPGYPPVEIVRRKYPEAYAYPNFHNAIKARSRQNYFFLGDLGRPEN